MQTPRSTLDEIYAAIWNELTRAAVDRHHPWRTPVLATIANQGQLADARTVVVREVTAGHLTIYTDARSPKVTQIEEHPYGTFVFWSPQLHWQVRAEAHLTVVRGGERVTQAWHQTQTSPQARDYLAAQAPGTALREPTDAVMGEGVSFALIDAAVTRIDWLELGRAGHRRATWTENARGWVQP